jgi:hypothetical protein
LPGRLGGLVHVFGNSPDFWLNVATDIWQATPSPHEMARIERAKPLSANAVHPVRRRSSTKPTRFKNVADWSVRSLALRLLVSYSLLGGRNVQS